MPKQNKYLKKGKIRREQQWTKAFVCVMLLFCFCAVPAFAEEPIDLDQDVMLILDYYDEKLPIAGAKFDLYHVGTISEDAKFSLTGDFSDYPVAVDSLEEEGWEDLARTLYGYAQRDEREPIDTGRTDVYGNLKFPVQMDSLKPGLYMAVADRHVQNGKIYTAEPFMVWMPDRNIETGEWCYEVTALPKQEQIPADKEPEFISRKVLKVWNDERTYRRPTKITVDLLKDGQVYDSAALNASNNWRFTWENLSDEFLWTVAEQEVNGYTVSVGKEGITFVITNTSEPSEPGNPGGGGGSSGGSDTPPEPKNPVPELPKPPGVERSQRSGGGSDDAPSWAPSFTDDLELQFIDMMQVPLAGWLPQTGQLWWPVPLLTASGLLFLIVGLIVRRKEQDIEP